MTTDPEDKEDNKKQTKTGMAGFFDRHKKISAVWNFVMHPTIWRVAAVAAALTVWNFVTHPTLWRVAAVAAALTVRNFVMHPTILRIAAVAVAAALTVWNFVMHPTIWRVAAVAAALALTIMSGGAAVPVIGLISTFTTSLISIVGKTWKMRKVERASARKALLEEVRKTKRDSKALPNANRVMKAVNIKPLVSTVGAPADKVSKSKTIKAALATVGAECIAPVVIAIATFDVVGATAYTASLLFGIGKIATYSISGGAFIKSEFKDRVEMTEKEYDAKREVAVMCEQLGIDKDHQSTAQLQTKFKEQMIEQAALRRVCALLEKDEITEGEIPAKFEEARKDLEKKMEFEAVQNTPSRLSTLRRALNPFGKTYYKIAEPTAPKITGAPELEKGYTIPPSQNRAASTTKGVVGPETTPHQNALDKKQNTQVEGIRRT